MTADGRPYQVLPYDRWAAATGGLVNEVARLDAVFFTSLVDASAIAALRQNSADRGRGQPSYTAIVLKAIALALREHPALNRLVLGGRFRHRPVQLHEIHATVAVERTGAEGDTVYAGVIRDTDHKSLATIHQELRQLSAGEEKDDPRLRLFMRLVRWAPGFLCRWLCGLPRLGPGLWRTHRGGSFALTTVGKYGVDAIAAKWPWPLTFTFGQVKERPVAVAGRVVARPTFYLSMGFDRRLCNGAPAARFFNRVVDLLERDAAKLADDPPPRTAPAAAPPRPGSDLLTAPAAVGH